MAPMREWTVTVTLADGSMIERKCTAKEHYEAVGVGMVQFWRDCPGHAIVSAKAVTLCKYGHPLEGENLKINVQGFRICMMCARQASRESIKRNGKKRRGKTVIPAKGSIFDHLSTFCKGDP